jgi:acyl-coenzyme A thioesterase PaaI-like protein
MGATRDEPGPERDVAGLVRPEGCTLDLTYVLGVATQTNVAHRELGTQLVALERHGVTLGVAWRADLVERDGGGLSNGVLATMLDHTCSLAVLMTINDERLGGATMGLRVDYLALAEPGRSVHVRAECVHRASRVAFVLGSAFHPEQPDAIIARATCTVAVQPEPAATT